jgi:hypothetical protein
MRIVGRRDKTVYERFEEIQRRGRLYRRRRQAKIEVQQPDGTWAPCSTKPREPTN